jgi:hypothetical protein
MYTRKGEQYDQHRNGCNVKRGSLHYRLHGIAGAMTAATIARLLKTSILPCTT